MFTEKLIEVATAELKAWTDGAWVECGGPGKNGSKRVATYWHDALGLNLTGCNDVAWSAAFICYCMDRAGMLRSEFPYSPGHHAYIRWAINNTKAAKPSKSYYGRRVQEYAPKPGDMIAQWRKAKKTDPDPNVSFDHQPESPYISHCDIVIENLGSKVRAVGGNVSNRVKVSEFEAIGGILIPKKSLIAVLECKKP